MALLSQLFTALLLLHFGLHLVGGSEAAAPQTLSCPASAGVPGTPGHNGIPGRDGRDGRDGAAGPKGERGEPGLSVHGPPGKAGPEGPVGPAGPKGQKGELDKTYSLSLDLELKALKTRLSAMEKAASFQIFKKVGQKYFLSNRKKANFDEGLKLCADAGGTLVLPRNEAENEALSAMHDSLGSTYIQLGTTDREIEGQFVDVNNKPLTFTKWSENEPNNYNGNEDCAGIHTSAIWNDVPCDNILDIVCEFEP